MAVDLPAKVLLEEVASAADHGARPVVLRPDDVLGRKDLHQLARVPAERAVLARRDDLPRGLDGRPNRGERGSAHRDAPREPLVGLLPTVQAMQDAGQLVAPRCRPVPPRGPLVPGVPARRQPLRRRGRQGTGGRLLRAANRHRRALPLVCLGCASARGGVSCLRGPRGGRWRLSAPPRERRRRRAEARSRRIAVGDGGDRRMGGAGRLVHAGGRPRRIVPARCGCAIRRSRGDRRGSPRLVACGRSRGGPPTVLGELGPNARHPGVEVHVSPMVRRSPQGRAMRRAAKVSPRSADAALFEAPSGLRGQRCGRSHARDLRQEVEAVPVLAPVLRQPFALHEPEGVRGGLHRDQH
mmetsp:Transcript_32203/g.76578  ORF Transcript_32203/g.76578 Transcript_32203/m.76578 type:complete len:354 (+) Transcript_32203:1022-2083(+)